MRGFVSNLSMLSSLIMCPRICLVLGFGLAASACGGGNGEAPNSGDGTATEVAELILELSIGDDFAAAPEYQFSRIRSILIASDRTIWVADITEHQYRRLMGFCLRLARECSWVE